MTAEAEIRALLSRLIAAGLSRADAIAQIRAAVARLETPREPLPPCSTCGEPAIGGDRPVYRRGPFHMEPGSWRYFCGEHVEMGVPA